MDYNYVLQQGGISPKKKLKWEKVSSVCFRGTYRAGKIINKSKELINTQLGTTVNWEGG